MTQIFPMLAIDLQDLCWLLFVGFFVLSNVFGGKKKTPEEEEQEMAEFERLMEEEKTAQAEQPQGSGQVRAQKQAQPPQLAAQPTSPSPVAQTTAAPDLKTELERLMRGVAPQPVQPEPTTTAPQHFFEEPPTPPVVEERESPPLTAAKDAYTEASKLHERVVERMEGVSESVRHHTVAPTGDSVLQPQAIQDAVAMVRRPEGARQAIIASVILGSPRALGQGQDSLI
ncbi:MAG: hypothetical protein CMO64_01695 [Verrucomicrobiales bacterium]|nr:hypothetical protein [Verrucomicrobiales bacterium]